MSKSIEGGNRSRIGLLVEVLKTALDHPDYLVYRLQGSVGINGSQWGWVLKFSQRSGLARFVESDVRYGGQIAHKLLVTGKGLEVVRRYDSLIEFIRDGNK